MSRLISRDPFARQELHRESVAASGRTCDWCGSDRTNKKLFCYYSESDGGSKHRHKGLFCSKSCHDDYHG